MSCLGVHFALSPEDQTRVLAARDDFVLRDMIREDFEERYLGEKLAEWSYESDKAWDAIHRCLTNGELDFESPPFPLSRCILGGRPLYGSDDYIICYVTPEQVKELAAALPAVTQEWMRERYFRISPGSYGLDLSDDDFEYTWENFSGLPAFFQHAADASRAVIFTADQ